MGRRTNHRLCRTAPPITTKPTTMLIKIIIGLVIWFIVPMGLKKILSNKVYRFADTVCEIIGILLIVWAVWGWAAAKFF